MQTLIPDDTVLRPSRFWTIWLVVVLGGTLAMGLGFVLLTSVTERFFHWLVFTDPAVPGSFGAAARDYQRFVYGVLGAVIAGWSGLMLAVANGPFRRGERWAWIALAASVGGWFVVDTAYSLLTGYWPNAVFNAAFLLALAPPLLMTRRQFTGTR